MPQIILKDEFDEMTKVKGEMRGNGPRNIGEFILKQEGERGLKQVEDIMGKLGYPIKYTKIDPMGFQPLWLVSITLLAAKRLFNFSNEDFQKMGEADVKFTSIQRLFMKYFISIEQAAKAASKMWAKYNIEGNLELAEYNEKERRVVLRVTNWALNEYHCQYLIGYFRAVTQMAAKGVATCEETKCVHRGDKYHEFLIKW
ncbi:MAG: hypothetical protein WC514_03050 [Candidatus Paceibacterota bacterium]